MIEIIDGFPDSVIAITAVGRVNANDYDTVVIPKIEEALKRHHRVRLYYEFGPKFTGVDTGAAWKDFKLGVEHLTRWERMAVVTDVEWIRLTMNAFRFVMPGELKVFTNDQSAEARAWIMGK
jgi:hypothetical protein